MRPNLLIVVQDESIREQLLQQLKAVGYAVEVAHDAIQAGHAILRSAPDLIVCDVELPYMSGLEFAAALKADPNVRRMPVVFLVPLERADDYLAALSETEYLTTPLHTGRLVNVVARQLQRGAVDQTREGLSIV
jgi:DNA-binding response OmpR family regulator